MAVWPPYWLEATSFMIWVIWVAAMAMDFGLAIGALPSVKPLASMSQKFGSEQLDCAVNGE